MRQVYQINQLDELADLNKPAKLAVIGQPVAHSASPGMHQAGLVLLEVEASYIRLEVSPGELKHAVEKLRSLDFIGCNVTVPHKEEARQCCDQLTDEAKMFGVVNTMVFGNEVLGHNTDAQGFTNAVRDEFGNDLADLRVMILGAGGGAGRAVAKHCARIGCDQLFLVNRTIQKATDLADELEVYYESRQDLAGPGDRVAVVATDDAELIEKASHAELIINATSLGMKPTDPLPLPAKALLPHHLVYDMVYQPMQTELLLRAQRAGARTANGLSMLLHQGVLAFEYWFPESRAINQKLLETMRDGLHGQFR